MKKIFQQRLLWRLGTFVYFSLLFYIVFLARRRRDIEWIYERRTHYIPFKNDWQFLTQSKLFTASELYDFFSNTIGNIFLFIPYSLSLAFVWGIKSPGKIIIYALFTSFFIECTQLLLRLGFADVGDLILNTLGATIGVLLIKPLQNYQLAPLDTESSNK